MNFQFKPIASIHTPYKEKFCIPRQPGLVPSAEGVIQFPKDFRLKTALLGLEEFSHIWVVFVFHEHKSKDWKPSIRPPRLGGAKKKGVLASRSPHRPNPIGISVFPLLGVDLNHKLGPQVRVGSIDLLDGTPILDIKPYIPYADSVPNAKSGWASEPITRHKVYYTDEAREQIQEASVKHSELPALIDEILSIDPRPASQQTKIPISSPESNHKKFGVLVLDYDVKWQIENGGILVTGLAMTISKPGVNPKSCD